MAKVVSIGDYKNRDSVAILRELYIRASRGEIDGLAYNVSFKDGRQKGGFTGRFKADPAEALKVANRISQYLNQVQDLQDAAAIGGKDESSSGSHTSPRRLRRDP